MARVSIEDDIAKAQRMVGRELDNLFPDHTPNIGEEIMRVEDWTVLHPTVAGRKVSAGKLSRSPGGSLLVARWHVEPEIPSHLKRRASTTLTGPVNSTRLALVDAGKVARVVAKAECGAILAAAAATGLLLTVGLAYVLYLTFRGDASGQEARSSSAQVSPGWQRRASSPRRAGTWSCSRHPMASGDGCAPTWSTGFGSTAASRCC